MIEGGCPQQSSTIFSAASLWLLSTAEGFWTLAAARVLQGITSGLATSALLAWMIDLAPASGKRFTSAAAAGGPSAGFCLGALAAGVWTRELGWSAVTLAELQCGIALLLACLAFLLPETVRHPQLLLREALRPRVAVPRRMRSRFFALAAAVSGTWGFAAFIQTFASLAVESLLGRQNELAAAVFFVLYTLPFALGGFLLKASPQKVFGRAGAAGMLFAAGITAALGMGSAAAAFLLLLPAGVSAGLLCTAAMRQVLDEGKPAERAGLLSAFYLLGYLGSFLPTMAASALVSRFPPVSGAMAELCWAAGGMLLCSLLLRREECAKEERLKAKAVPVREG